MSEPYIAQVQIWGCLFAPRMFSYTDGQLLPIASNTALFSLIGIMYGGDGRYNFALPNLEYGGDYPGRTVMGNGSGPGLTTRDVSKVLGTGSVTLTASQMPQHNHTAIGHDSNNENDSPTGKFVGFLPTGYQSGEGDNTMADQSISYTGAGQSHNNWQPYLTLNYTIAVAGVYPARN